MLEREREREREREGPQAWLGQGNWDSSLGRSEFFPVFFSVPRDGKKTRMRKTRFQKLSRRGPLLHKTHSSPPAIRATCGTPIQTEQILTVTIPIGTEPEESRRRARAPSGREPLPSRSAGRRKAAAGPGRRPAESRRRARAPAGGQTPPGPGAGRRRAAAGPGCQAPNIKAACLWKNNRPRAP